MYLHIHSTCLIPIIFSSIFNLFIHLVATLFARWKNLKGYIIIAENIGGSKIWRIWWRMWLFAKFWHAKMDEVCNVGCKCWTAYAKTTYKFLLVCQNSVPSIYVCYTKLSSYIRSLIIYCKVFAWLCSLESLHGVAELVLVHKIEVHRHIIMYKNTSELCCMLNVNN